MGLARHLRALRIPKHAVTVTLLLLTTRALAEELGCSATLTLPPGLEHTEPRAPDHLGTVHGPGVRVDLHCDARGWEPARCAPPARATDDGTACVDAAQRRAWRLGRYGRVVLTGDGAGAVVQAVQLHSGARHGDFVAGLDVVARGLTPTPAWARAALVLALPGLLLLVGRLLAQGLGRDSRCDSGVHPLR